MWEVLEANNSQLLYDSLIKGMWEVLEANNQKTFQHFMVDGFDCLKDETYEYLDLSSKTIKSEKISSSVKIFKDWLDEQLLLMRIPDVKMFMRISGIF